jgi:hypothetical protein
MSYNGLTIADKDALLDAQAKGAEWVARDMDFSVYGYVGRPIRSHNGTWWRPNDAIESKCMQLDASMLLFVHWSDPDPVHIPTALAQIAEMERDKWQLEAQISEGSEDATQKPRTNQDALIEKMRDVREMAEERIYHGDYMFHGDFVGEVIIFSDKRGETKNFDKAHDDALEREIKWLLSPAEKGEPR